MSFDKQSLARIKTVREALGPAFAFLRAEWCLWHRTSIEGLRGILAAGAIIPNDGRFPDRYSQSKNSYARQLGAVSMFDLYSLPEDRALLSGMDWLPYLIDQPRASVWIRIDPARLDPFKVLLPPEIYASFLRDTQDEMGEFLFHVEALHIGPLPRSAFVEFVVFREIRKFVTVPVGPGALDTIEAQCRKWHAEEEAEYASKGIKPGASRGVLSDAEALVRQARGLADVLEAFAGMLVHP